MSPPLIKDGPQSANPLSVSGPQGQANGLQFFSKYVDRETALVNFGYRYYSASLGRFINRDPVDEKGRATLLEPLSQSHGRTWSYIGLAAPNEADGSARWQDAMLANTSLAHSNEKVTGAKSVAVPGTADAIKKGYSRGLWQPVGGIGSGPQDYYYIGMPSSGGPDLGGDAANLYAYVGNNPMGRMDPLGLDWTDYVPNWLSSPFSYSGPTYMTPSGRLFDATPRSGLSYRQMDLARDELGGYDGGQLKTFGEILRTGAEMHPVVGRFNDGYAAFTGKDPVNYSEVSGADRVQAGSRTAAMFFGFFGSLSRTAAKNVVSLDANAIRFSQSNVRSSLGELTQSMKANGWQGPPIDVVRMADGSLVAVDNTRLAAASLSKTPVQAVIRGFGETFPGTRAFGNLQGATWGEAVMNRIRGQRPAWQRLDPNGSPFTGVHPSAPGLSR